MQFAIPVEEQCFQLGETFNQLAKALANCSPASLNYLDFIDKVLEKLRNVNCYAHLY